MRADWASMLGGRRGLPGDGCPLLITIRQTPATGRLIEAIPDEAWTPIPYWIDGGADVAETTYTPFADQKDAVPVRLIVRRVRPTPGSQLAPAHPVRLPRLRHRPRRRDPRPRVRPPAPRRDRERDPRPQVRGRAEPAAIREVPCQRAWLAVQVIAHNLARWTARIGLGDGIVTTKTLRRRLFGLVGPLTRWRAA